MLVAGRADLHYDHAMAGLIEKMKRSPRNIRFDELDRFLADQGFESRQRGGSHVVYRRGSQRLVIVKPHGGRTTVNRAAIADVLRQLEL